MKPVSPTYKSPKRVLEELGITDPEDIDIEAIAEHCEATIVYEPLTGSEARILGNGDKAIITINKNSPRQRQRFSAGHELGHWQRDRGKIALSCTDRTYKTEWNEDNPEQRANRYAVDLLMPEPMFRPRTTGLPITFDTARMLCGVFNTSLTATAIRLVDLSSFNAMIACYEGGKRKWFVRGPDIPEALWPYDTLSKHTKAYDLLQGASPPLPARVSADAWVNHRDAWQFNVREDSIITGPGMVLSLVWWQEEKQILDINEENEERDDDRRRRR
jgi:Zn-dependent peptidase ImmA (M78 family)